MESDEIRLTMLGTGGGFDRSDVGHTNALLETPEETLLIDCSLYALDALAEIESFNDDPLEVDGVVVTHIHGDHVSGLEELGFRHKFLGDDRDRPILYTHPKILPSRWGATIEHDGTDLWENYLKGPMMHRAGERGEKVVCSLEEWFDPRPTNQIELAGGRWTLTFVPVEHVPGKDGFGFLLTTSEESPGVGGPSILYSGDTRPIEQDDLYEDVDVIFHDCHLAPKEQVGIQTIHTHIDELLEMPEHVQSNTIIMHYGDGADAMEAVNGTKLTTAFKGETFKYRASEEGVDRDSTV